jgi:hypothetical protein
MEMWLPTLKAASPQEGFELAVKLSRVAVKLMQPSDAVRTATRKDYETDSAQLIAASHVVAANFQTVAAANAYWRA